MVNLWVSGVMMGPVLLLLRAVGAGAEPPLLPQCAANQSVVTGIGYTGGSKYFNLTKKPNVESCCALCATTSQCQVWTFHPPSSTCTLGESASINSNAPQSTVSGSKIKISPSPPAPPAPRPPAPPSPVQPIGPVKPGSPNIIFFLTDDQDAILGGWDPLQQSQKLLTERGATGTYWVTHTPVCCPSRTELLSSRYFHNIKVPKITDSGCMHCQSHSEWADRLLFAPHLRAAGYRVGIFGKYLNSGNPMNAPPGVETWFGNGGGSYINPSFSYEASAGEGGKNVKFDNETAPGAAYSTSVIGNISVPWIRAALQDPHPFMAYIAPKAPHIQDGPGFPMTIPAPWYTDAFTGIKAPRTPSWNYSASDHHWMIAQQPPMTTEQAMNSDLLYMHRWQSLLSVDDLVAAVVKEVENAGAIDKTYFLYSSDHGYRFGQFRMPQGKWNVYDNNIRIPFVIAGPGIRANSTFDYIGSNVDVMPTVLGLAGLPTPSTMDGRSIAPELINTSDRTVPLQTLNHANNAHGSTNRQPWRSDQLIEYYGLGNVIRYEHLEDTYNNTFRALRIMDVNPETGLRKDTPFSNALYAEFTDTRIDYNFTGSPQFYELYDLDTDPWMMKNAYGTADPQLKADLHQRLVALFGCRGSPDSTLSAHQSQQICN